MNDTLPLLQQPPSEAATALGRLLAFLAPAPLDDRLFESEAGATVIREAAALIASATANQFAKMSVPELLKELITWGAAKQDGTLLIPDPAKLEDLRAGIPPTQKAAWIEKALQLVNTWTPIESDDPAKWKLFGHLKPHIVHVLKLAEAQGIAVPTGTLMGEKYGVYVALQGNLEEAETLCRRSLEIHEGHFGPRHRTVAVDCANLAWILQGKIRKSEARSMRIRAADIMVDLKDKDPPTYAIMLSNLVPDLAEYGLMEEAERLSREALQVDESHHGPSHPFVARDLKILAGVFAKTGRLQDAESLLRKALEVDEKCMGSNHPYVARDLKELAGLLRELSSAEGLEVLYRRALEIDQGWYAPDSEVVLEDLLLAADANLKRGRGDRAEVDYRRIVDTYERLKPAVNTPLLVSCFRLALLRVGAKDYAGAIPFYRRALALAGPEANGQAPRASTVRFNLIQALRHLGRFAEARDLVLEEREQDLTARILANPGDTGLLIDLANFFREERGDFEKAEKCFRKAFELDPEGPGVANSLAVFLTTIRGNHDEAEALYHRAIELHPQDGPTLHNYAVLLLNIHRDIDSAEQLCRMAWKCRPGHSFIGAGFASLLITKGSFAEADAVLREAWQSLTGKHERSSARLLLYKAAMERLKQRDDSLFLGQLKVLFNIGIAHVPWMANAFQDHLRGTLGADDYALFATIIAVIGDKTRLAQLEQVPRWMSLSPVPLETSWDLITEI